MSKIKKIPCPQCGEELNGKLKTERPKKIEYRCDKCNITITHPANMEIDGVVV